MELWAQGFFYSGCTFSVHRSTSGRIGVWKNTIWIYRKCLLHYEKFLAHEEIEESYSLAIARARLAALNPRVLRWKPLRYMSFKSSLQLFMRRKDNTPTVFLSHSKTLYPDHRFSCQGERTYSFISTCLFWDRRSSTWCWWYFA